jgi:hypothetical protein
MFFEALQIGIYDLAMLKLQGFVFFWRLGKHRYGFTWQR